MDYKKKYEQQLNILNNKNKEIKQLKLERDMYKEKLNLHIINNSSSLKKCQELLLENELFKKDLLKSINVQKIAARLYREELLKCKNAREKYETKMKFHLPTLLNSIKKVNK